MVGNTPTPPRLKRGTSVSQETLRDTILHSDAKRGRFETLFIENTSNIPPLESIPEPSFDDMVIQLLDSTLVFQQNTSNTCYPTKLVEEVQSSNHLRSVLGSLGPLPAVSLHILITAQSAGAEGIPSFKVTFPTTSDIFCSASISSPKFTLIPCDLQVFSESLEDGRYMHTVSIRDVPASLSDAVLVLRYSTSSTEGRRCFAIVVCEFEQSRVNGVPRLTLSKLATGSKETSQNRVQASIPSKSFRLRKNSSHDRMARTKPNLSLAIPPTQQTNLMKAALTASLRTPLGSSGFHTPQEQRIETPTVPPPLKTEISPYALRNFCGTPTEPITPSLEHTYPATSLFNRLTMGAIAAGTPNIVREEPVPLASPMIVRPPILRRSSSLCHTPGGYFRL